MGEAWLCPKCLTPGRGQHYPCLACGSPPARFVEADRLERALREVEEAARAYTANEIHDREFVARLRAALAREDEGDG